MDANKFLLSIIIPTKNRQEFALKAVEQILQINDGSIQIVIQDNSDNQILGDKLSIFNDDIHIKYNHTEGIISFVDNFSLAVSFADGEYVCIIGDDDGVLPQILDATKWASENNIDAIKPEQSAVYFWPNSNAVGSEEDNGNLYIHKITGESRMCDPYKEVIKLLNRGGQKYLSLDMVKLYHGVVKKKCLDNIKQKTGVYFKGLTPDIYISVALSLTVEKVVKIDYPLTISGICNKSGSADSVTGRHTGKLEDAPHFRGHKEYEWSSYVPKFYSVETIWADSALAAIKALNKTELYGEFNVAALSAYCLKKHPDYKKIIVEHLKDVTVNKNSYRLIFPNYLRYPVMDFVKRVFRRIMRKKSDSVHFTKVENIMMAEAAIQHRLNGINVNIEGVLLSAGNFYTNQ